jgi:hypothetical protein
MEFAAQAAYSLLRDHRDTLLALLPGEDTARLDYIERTFTCVTNQERYLPLQILWGKSANGRTLREACDKYMKRDATPPPTDAPDGERR